MAKIKVEVEHCWECQCKYLKRECGYSPDPFEGRSPMYRSDFNV